MILIPALVILLGVAVYFAAFLPSADWYVTFDPAARGVYAGHWPYENPGYRYPPWAILPLLPMVLFPPLLAHGLMVVVTALVLIYIAWRLRAQPLAVAAFLLSPTAVGILLVNNLDPFAISGIFLPPVWGVFVLVIKPQVGVGVMLYYLFQTWKNERFWGCVRTFAPMIIAYSISVAFFPIWVTRMLENPSNSWNRSLFPYAIPVGLLIMWLAIRRKNPYFALAASVFLTPYMTFYSYIAVQIALLHKDVEKVIRRDVLQIILTIFLWVVTLVFHL
jgi:hypothetical protein